MASLKLDSLTNRVRAVLAEDCYENDLASTQLGEFLNANPAVSFEIIAKESMIFCGQSWIKAFAEIGLLEVQSMACDGDQILCGQQILIGRAKLCQVLSFERTLLNGLQRWSGVATLTSRSVSALDRAYRTWSKADRREWVQKPRLLHTRKTTPLWRDLEVQGVRAGGGFAHRMSLAEQAMVKENHKEPVLRLCGEWSSYLKQVIDRYPDAVIEVETWNEARQVIELGAGVLLMDNFSSDDLRAHLAKFLIECREQGFKLPQVEVSGGITPSNIEEYVIPGVTRISMGALTHAYRSVDLSLNILHDDLPCQEILQKDMGR